MRISPAGAAALRKYFDGRDAARADARRLKDLPTGRYPSIYDRASATVSTEGIRTLHVAPLLWLDAVLSAHEGGEAELVDICVACIHNARSLGDEPSEMGHLIYVACMETALRVLSHVLGQTTLTPAELQRLQELLEREIDEPRLLWATRGERALLVELFQAVHEGRVEGSTGFVKLSRFTFWLPKWLRGARSLNRANLLRAMNEIVAASRLPTEQQCDEVQRIVDARQRSDPEAATVLEVFMTSFKEAARCQAELRNAVLALAAERYRQEQGFWPGSLDELVRAGHVKRIPVDPYDGKAMRYRRMADGALFYSTGADRVDNGGLVSQSHPLAPGTDLGLQLWDPEARGRPAR